MMDLRTAKFASLAAETVIVDFAKAGKKFSDTSYLQSKKEINDIRNTLNRIEHALEHVKP